VFSAGGLWDGNRFKQVDFPDEIVRRLEAVVAQKAR
jgi:hypothetical protein